MIADLVFYPKWPSFVLDLEIIRSVNKVFFDLAWWPSFWPQVTQFQPDLEIIKTNILSKIHDDCLKSVTSSVLTIFLLIWPGDLVFYPKWPSFKLYLDFIGANILSKFHQDYLKLWPLECEQTNCWQRMMDDDRRRTEGDHNSSPWALLRWAKNLEQVIWLTDN